MIRIAGYEKQDSGNRDEYGRKTATEEQLTHDHMMKIAEEYAIAADLAGSIDEERKYALKRLELTRKYGTPEEIEYAVAEENAFADGRYEL